MHVKEQCTLTDEGGFEGFEGEDEGGQGFEGKGDNWNVTEHATRGGGGGAARPPPNTPALVKQQSPFFKPNKPMACQACPHKKGKATRKRSWWLKNGEK